MKRTLVVLIVILLTGAYLGRPAKGDDAPKEQTYIAVFYCMDTQSVLKQRQSGEHKIVVGFSLPNMTPGNDDSQFCIKRNGIPMVSYVQITPPFANLVE